VRIKIEANLSIAYDDQDLLNVIYNAMRPEVEDSSKEKSKIYLNKINNKINLIINADKASAFRASVNSYLRWIKLIKQIYDL